MDRPRGEGDRRTRIRLRAEIRRHRHIAHLRAGTSAPRRDARRRHARRRGDGERAYHTQRASGADGRGVSRLFRDTRRDTHALRLVRPPERRAGGRGRASVRQSAQRRGGNAQAAAVAGGGPTRTRLHAVPAGGRRPAPRIALGEHGGGARMGIQDIGQHAHLPQPRADNRIYRVLGLGAQGSAVPHRRRGRQGQPLRRPPRLGRDVEGSQMGRGL